MFDHLVVGLTVIGGLFSGGYGSYLYGRYKINNKVMDLKQLRSDILLSQQSHNELVFEIDNKIKQMEAFQKLSVFSKKIKV